MIRPPETYKLENGYIGIVENPGAVAENDTALAMLAKWWLQIAIDKGEISVHRCVADCGSSIR